MGSLELETNEEKRREEIGDGGHGLKTRGSPRG